MCNANSIDASKYQLQTLKWCPRCCQCMYGNYCNMCGTKLEDKAQEITCPCCKGTGKINPIHQIKDKLYKYFVIDDWVVRRLDTYITLEDVNNVNKSAE